MGHSEGKRPRMNLRCVSAAQTAPPFPTLAQVIVFGAESTGKSTILERIAMLPIFPEGKDLCTRTAVDVRLRYANQTKRTAQLGVYLTEDGLAPDGYKSQPLDIDSPDGKNKVREIMEMITKVDGKRTVDKEKTIRITVKGRDLPSEFGRKL